jgi:hypothetical protein
MNFTIKFPKFELTTLGELNASMQRRRDPGGLEKVNEEELLDEMAQSKSNLIAESIERATFDHAPQEKCLFWKTTS